jgi:hypothetical protein
MPSTRPEGEAFQLGSFATWPDTKGIQLKHFMFWPNNWNTSYSGQIPKVFNFVV